MSEYKLTIPKRLISLNDYINIERADKYIAAAEKSKIETEIRVHCIDQLHGVHIEKPVTITYKWYERDRRRDKDNICFAKKFIQDALVSARVLKGDGWKYIQGFSDEFYVDKAKPRVEIILNEIQQIKELKKHEQR